MHMPPMDWNDLKILLAISRSGSFVRAGSLLRLSHTTVSRRLAALEKDLGVKLFERVDQMLVPREVCLPFISAAEAVEAQMFEVTHGVKTFDERPHGLVRIITMPWILRHLLAPALPDFVNAFPDVSLQLIGDVRDRDYAHGRTDVSLRFELQPRKGEMTRTVATMPYSLYGPAGRDIAGLPTLMFWDEFSSYAPDRWHKSRDDAPVLIRANDAGVIHQAITGGDGHRPDTRLSRRIRHCARPALRSRARTAPCAPGAHPFRRHEPRQHAHRARMAGGGIRHDARCPPALSVGLQSIPVFESSRAFCVVADGALRQRSSGDRNR